MRSMMPDISTPLYGITGDLGGWFLKEKNVSSGANPFMLTLLLEDGEF